MTELDEKEKYKYCSNGGIKTEWKYICKPDEVVKNEMV